MPPNYGVCHCSITCVHVIWQYTSMVVLIVECHNYPPQQLGGESEAASVDQERIGPPCDSLKLTY